MLTVYKASAGSGKTFQLVAEYLKLLLKKPSSYRNILAVTFTNKATQEMKNRILEQLYMLAVNKNSDYLPLLKEELSLDEEIVRKRSKEVLKNILHDYSRFSVSTIDSFTQKVIRAFNREMGISPNFELELDSKIVLEEAVDRLLVKIDTDRQLRKWLIKFSEEKIRDNRSQRIEEDVKKLGEELFKENFQMFFPDGSDEENPYSRENLDVFFKELDQIINSHEQALKKRAAECLKIIENAGFSEDDFLYKKSGVAGYIGKLHRGNFGEPGKRAIDAAESAERWFTARHKHAAQLQQLVENELQYRLKEIISIHETGSVFYVSAVEVKKQLRMLGILTDLKEEIRLLLIEKETIQIGDSNLLLNKIIGNSDTPFIYEKIGNRYSYFMLDEFQDTSSLQWANFKPLIANALSEGNSALLVGDVKQSIYRWRNSDWNILASQINDDFPHYPPNEIALEKNWRSRLNVIDFNNAAFEVLINSFENLLVEEIESESPRDKFSSVYSHFVQKPGKPADDKTGMAEITFLPEEDFDENSLELLVNQVKRLQDNGLKASDIAILLRKNSEGAKVVKTFLDASEKPENEDYNLSVLSGESLFLYASQAVNFVILIIQLLIDGKNDIHKAALLHIWLSWLRPALLKKGLVSSDGTVEKNTLDTGFGLLFESELSEKISQLKEKVLMLSLDETVTEICALFGLFEVETELPFLQTLIDKAAEQKISLSNDLSNFLHWWNEKGFETSVSVNDELDAVRLLTVHKAKGLEFEAVLLPFFNWNISWQGFQTPTLWCRPSQKPFSRFPLLPVRASQRLTGTIFKEDYIQEKTSSFIDTINLVYVAFTRAKSVLFINSLRKEKAERLSKAVNSVLDSALQILSERNQFQNCWDESRTVFSYGEIPVFDTLKAIVSPVLIEDYSFFEFGKRIRLQSNSDNFLELSEQSRSVKNFGKLVHKIFAAVNTADDIETACMAAFKEGRINSAEKDEVLKKLKSSLQNPVIAQWFAGDFIVLNERNLLSSENMYRPDRIMISDNRAVVVDYKWGEKNSGKYNRQVQNYTRMLKESGFKSAEGYLWYINLDEVERVV